MANSSWIQGISSTIELFPSTPVAKTFLPPLQTDEELLKQDFMWTYQDIKEGFKEVSKEKGVQPTD